MFYTSKDNNNTLRNKNSQIKNNSYRCLFTLFCNNRQKNIMEICIWSPDWGLASVDFECLSMIAYAKFSGAPVNIKETDSPFWSSSGRLPVFYSSNGEDSNEQTKHSTITDLKEFIAHLRKKKFSADYNLSPKQQSEVIYILIFAIRD